jgi:protoheme IX farnesyltransferase
MKLETSYLADNVIVVNTPNGFANWLADFLILTKARVNVLVVATTFVGFALHADVHSNWLLLMNTLLGTGCVAGAAAAANQTLEWPFDRNMVRTQRRPIAAGRFSIRTGIAASALLLAAGCLWLGIAVNLRTVLIALMTFLVYVFAYTPLKRLTAVCVLVGAVAGALPVLIGWAATGADLGLWAAVAFTILFLWQVPHFLAIAWWFRADYAHAGYHVLPFDDRHGYWTASFALAFATVTVAISLVPVWLNQVTGWYLFGGFLLGTIILVCSIRLLIKRSIKAAQLLFIASLVYLPGLYLLMLIFRKQP